METTLERLADSRVCLEITVEAPRVAAALERAYRRLARVVEVPGFRKGRAPRQVLALRLGKGAILQEALEELLPAAYEEALRETALEPVDQPEIQVLEAEEGKPLRFRASVVVKPEVELGAYRGLEAVRRVRQVAEEEVDQLLEELRASHARLVPLDREEVREGDFATLDFEGFVDGRPFPGGAGKGVTVQVGSGRLLPALERGILGQRVGETREVPVVFPADHPRQELAGREARLRVTVLALKERQLPNLDDDFARELGEYTTLAEVRAAIRGELERRAREEADRAVRRDLLEQATRRAAVQVPSVLVERRAAALLRNLVASLEAEGLTLERYLAARGAGRESLEGELRSVAEKQVRQELVTEAIAVREGLEPSETEVEEACRRQGVDKPGAREALVRILRADRVLAFLQEHARIVEEPAPAQGADPSASA